MRFIKMCCLLLVAASYRLSIFWPAFANGASRPSLPTANQLMGALGRELWVVADELLTASAKVANVPSLGTSAISLRNAADSMCDGDWESVQGELEAASVSGTDYIPEECFEGLVNLFSYYEPVPQCEWQAASASLRSLSSNIAYIAPLLLRSTTGQNRDDASAALSTAVEVLNKAMRLFEPGSFYMPPDPRDAAARAGRGRAWQTSGSRRAPWERDSEDNFADPSLKFKEMQETLRSDVLSGRNVGSDVVSFIDRIDAELSSVESLPKDQLSRARQGILRKFLIELHPDQNRGREDEVIPAFRYVQSLREAIS